MFLQPQRWHRLRITDFLLPFHGQSPPAPAPCTNCPAFCFCIFRFFLECHINKSVQYRIFHVWLSLLSVMCSGPAILSYVLVHFFVLLSSIPCWGHTMSHFVYPFACGRAFVLFPIWLLWIRLLWAFTQTSCGHVFIPLSKYPGMELLVPWPVDVLLCEKPKYFPKCYRFSSSPAVYESSSYSTSPTLSIVKFKKISYLNSYMMLFHWSFCLCFTHD